MFWIRSMAVAVFLCATSSAFAEGMTLFGGEYFDSPLASPVSADASFSAFGVVGATDFASTRIALEASPSMPLATPRLSLDSVPLLNTSWQGSYGAHSTANLLNVSDPSPWAVSRLEEPSLSSFGTSHDRSSSIPRLMPDFASPIMQRDLMTPRWKLVR
jgi:hypothetical protein